MKHDRPAPCATCPFRRVGGNRYALHSIRRLAEAALAGDTVHQCHESYPTIVGTECVSHADMENCAGAQIFGGRRAVTPELRAELFDSTEEMVAANATAPAEAVQPGKVVAVVLRRRSGRVRQRSQSSVPESH